MNKFFSYLVGAILFLYGIIKITVTILSFTLSYDAKSKIENIPVVNFFINNDDTVAGRVIDVVLALFGVYTILHSLQLFNLPLPGWLYTLSSSEEVHYNVNMLLGGILFDFYVLVCYTNLAIPKTNADMFTYKVGGVAGGLGFFLSVPIMYLYFTYGKPKVKRNLNNLFKYYRTKATLAILMACICFVGIVGVITEAFLNNPVQPKNHAVSGLVMSQLSYLA